MWDTAAVVAEMRKESPRAELEEILPNIYRCTSDPELGYSVHMTLDPPYNGMVLGFAYKHGDEYHTTILKFKPYQEINVGIFSDADTAIDTILAHNELRRRQPQ